MKVIAFNVLEPKWEVSIALRQIMAKSGIKQRETLGYKSNSLKRSVIKLKGVSLEDMYKALSIYEAKDKKFMYVNCVKTLKKYIRKVENEIN